MSKGGVLTGDRVSLRGPGARRNDEPCCLRGGRCRLDWRGSESVKGDEDDEMGELTLGALVGSTSGVGRTRSGSGGSRLLLLGSVGGSLVSLASLHGVGDGGK